MLREDHSGPTKTQVSNMKSIDLRFRPAGRRNHTALAVLVAAASCAVACSSSSGNGVGGTDRTPDQSDFTSSPPGTNFGNSQSADLGGSSTGTGGGLAPSASNGNATKASAAPASTPRKVEETDLYRVEGDRLYYLNGYRGLMVFDISTIDHPKMLGHS